MVQRHDHAMAIGAQPFFMAITYRQSVLDDYFLHSNANKRAPRALHSIPRSDIWPFNSHVIQLIIRSLHSLSSFYEGLRSSTVSSALFWFKICLHTFRVGAFRVQFAVLSSALSLAHPPAH